MCYDITEREKVRCDVGMCWGASIKINYHQFINMKGRRAGPDGSMSASGSAGPGFEPSETRG